MIKGIIAFEVPMLDICSEAQCMFLHPGFLAFTMVNVCPSTTAVSVRIWSKRFVQDIAGGGYPITWHLGSLTVLPLSAN